jgi:8-oxo-dGTP diphosphatase
MSQNKIVIASALLLNADNDLLVVRKKKSTFYMLPGGKVESNESYKDALLRELKEELELEFMMILNI